MLAAGRTVFLLALPPHALLRKNNTRFRGKNISCKAVLDGPKLWPGPGPDPDLRTGMLSPERCLFLQSPVVGPEVVVAAPGFAGVGEAEAVVDVVDVDPKDEVVLSVGAAVVDVVDVARKEEVVLSVATAVVVDVVDVAREEEVVLSVATADVVTVVPSLPGPKRFFPAGEGPGTEGRMEVVLLWLLLLLLLLLLQVPVERCKTDLFTSTHTKGSLAPVDPPAQGRLT